MGDKLAAPVYDPVDEEAYPERSLSEAQDGVVQYSPHDPDSASQVFVKHLVDGDGNSTLVPDHDALAEVGLLVPPHSNYVENPDAVPHYRAPVYDEPVTSGGVPVEETDYDDWGFEALKTEIEERDLDVEVPKSKKEAIKILTKDDKAQAE